MRELIILDTSQNLQVPKIQKCLPKWAQLLDSGNQEAQSDSPESQLTRDLKTPENGPKPKRWFQLLDPVVQPSRKC